MDSVFCRVQYDDETINNFPTKYTTTFNGEIITTTTKTVRCYRNIDYNCLCMFDCECYDHEYHAMDFIKIKNELPVSDVIMKLFIKKMCWYFYGLGNNCNEKPTVDIVTGNYTKNFYYPSPREPRFYEDVDYSDKLGRMWDTEFGLKGQIIYEEQQSYICLFVPPEQFKSYPKTLDMLYNEITKFERLLCPSVSWLNRRIVVIGMTFDFEM